MRAHAFVAAVALALSGVAGCKDGVQFEAPAEQGRSDRHSPVTAPEMRVDSVATAEPGMDRLQWRATNEVARSLTGNLTASLEYGRGGPLILAFANGITMRLERVGDQMGVDRIGPGTATFASTLSTDPNAGVYVYRVVEERLARSARQGGLCQKDDTRYVAISEFVNRSGDWVFMLAGFKGAAPPGPTTETEPQLCAALGFAVN
jgi:hypothetical protein